MIRSATSETMGPSKGTYLSYRYFHPMLCVWCSEMNVLSQTGLRYVFDAVTLKNSDAMEELLQSAIQKAVG